MRELHLKMSMSLDGFVAGPKGEIDWIFSSPDPEADKWEAKVISDTSLHLMGAKTYADMISWWPYSDDQFANPMNAIPKAVFTQHDAAHVKATKPSQAVKDAAKAAEASGEKRREPDPKILKAWEDAYIASGPMKDELAKLKKEDGKPMLAHGGAGFARSLIATGMVDRFHLLVHPIVLGNGLPIFTKVGDRLKLKLVESIAFPAGTVAQVYVPG
ncbi:MAG: dihydrofolate reductase [Burkholderiales bacterium]|nr:MAG: dihydrofolate reductase [Burkholderiales bacterium]